MLITVRDFGVGMSTSTVARLFSAFEQPGAPVEGRPGLGLGLTIARSIIETHGGQIWATSEGPGHGSVLEVELATTPPSDAAETPRVERAAGAVKDRVLVVEDHEDAGELLTQFLEHHGYDVTLATSLAAGMRIAGQSWYAILTDIGLGDGSGLDIGRYLQTATRRPKLLFALSGYGSPSDLDASRRAGFDQHLVKPVDLSQLLELLHEPRASVPQ